MRALLVLAIVARTASADAGDDRRALAMLRVLAYDTQLAQRAPGVVRVVIVCPATEAGGAELTRWTAAFGKAAKLKVDGRAVAVASHALEGLDRALAETRTAAIVACDGLAIPELARLARARKVLTFTTREIDVTRGLAVGVVPGDQRDEIVVNVPAAIAAGARFDAGLLQLARRVGGEP